MVNFTAADRVGDIFGYVGGIDAVLRWIGGGRRDGEDGGGGKYTHKVTEHELSLVEKNNLLLAENSALRSEKYTDNKVAALAAEVCNLKKQIAVNAAHDEDFGKYVEREFVHQPKASINESIVVCRQCRCEECACGNKRDRGYYEDRD